jgi:hypothetical protein
MATTTATVSINSSDLIPGQPLSINASHTLTKSGRTEGLEIVDIGRGTLAEASSGNALAEALDLNAARDTYTGDTSNWVYICNKSTNDLHLITVGIHDKKIGHLGSGEWLWMPWNQGDADAEINIQAEGVTGSSITYEYAIFSERKQLPAKS